MRRILWCVAFFVVARAGFFFYHIWQEHVSDTLQEPETEEVSTAENPLTGRLPYWQVDSAKTAIAVYDLEAGEMVFEQRADQLMAPASCMKLLTAVTALKRFGPDALYESRLLYDGTVVDGTLYGTLIFEGDDDPLFESFSSMTAALRRKGIKQIDGEIVLDLARSDTLRPHSSAAAWDIPYHKLPLLLRGEPYVRRTLLYSLAAAGISVRQGRSPVRKSSDESFTRRIWLNKMERRATQVASEKHSMREVLAPMLIHSSNIKAESVLWHIDNPLYRWSSMHISGAQQPCSALWTFIREEMPMEDTAGFVINDGSGLSPENRLTARFLTHLLAYAWNDDEIRHVLLDEALATPSHPVRRGSLIYRMSAPLFKGKVFCKTGTLTTIGSSSLSGYIHSDNGRWYAFSIINEDSPVWDSRLFQDRICRKIIEAR